MKVINESNCKCSIKTRCFDDQGKATHHALDTLGFKDLVKDVRIGKTNYFELNSSNEKAAKEEVTKCVKTFS